MHRHRLVIALLLAAAIGIAAGCGGEEVSPLPETVEGTVAQPATTAATTEAGGGATSEGDAAAGKTVFADNCGVCHTLSDAGTSGTVGPSLDGLALDFETVHNQVVNGGGAMPPFGGTLDEQQLNDVSAYVVQASAG